MPFLTAILFPYISSNSLILSKSGFQSAPISRKRPCATLYVLSVPRHPFRAWNMPRPGRIVGRPDALGLVPVRLKVSMDRAFFDVLRHWCTLHAITERKHKERGAGSRCQGEAVGVHLQDIGHRCPMSKQTTRPPDRLQVSPSIYIRV